MPYKFNESRRHKIPTARYRVTNWPDYDAAVQIALMVRTAFKLPFRQTEGLMASVMTLMELTLVAPDHTTMSRRTVSLSVARQVSLSHGPLHVLIDSTGQKVFGAGQWLETKHGAKSRRNTIAPDDRVAGRARPRCSDTGAPRKNR